MSVPAQDHTPDARRSDRPADGRSGCPAPSSIATPVPPVILTTDARLAPSATTRVATSLLHAYALAMAQGPSRPTLILVDLAATDGALTAPQLLAVLARRIRQGAIPPAWLVGVLPTPAPDLAAEAALAGCHLLLHAPLGDAVAAGLARLAQVPALPPPEHRATRAFHRLCAAELAEVVP